MRTKGFTLIELVIVIAIIGILSVVAMNGYSSYVTRANRTAAESFMMEVANRQKQYFLDARVYASDLATLGMNIPREVSAHYEILLSDQPVTPPAFLITARPPASSRQFSDGNLTLSSNGTKTPSEKW